MAVREGNHVVRGRSIVISAVMVKQSQGQLSCSEQALSVLGMGQVALEA